MTAFFQRQTIINQLINQSCLFLFFFIRQPICFLYVYIFSTFVCENVDVLLLK